MRLTHRVGIGAAVTLLVVVVATISATLISLPASGWQLMLPHPMSFQYGRVVNGKIVLMGSTALVSFEVDRGYGVQTLVLSGKWKHQLNGGYEMDLDNCLTGARFLKFDPSPRTARTGLSPWSSSVLECDHCSRELVARLGDAGQLTNEKVLFHRDSMLDLRTLRRWLQY